MSHHGKGRPYGKWSRNDSRRSDSRGRSKPVIGEKAREALENIEDDSPVIKSFRVYAAELDLKHDKFERIVKLSRDITIESKRIIFLLHSADRESKKATVLEEAEARLSNLYKTSFKSIAEELEGEDSYQFLRAYYPGLQEYIEATTFYHYMKSGTLCHWKVIQKNLTYRKENSEEKVKDTEEKVEDTEEKVEVTEEKVEDTEEKVEDTKESDGKENEEEQRELVTLLPPLDYVMGVADLTGELMRKCINSLGTGDLVICHQTCSFVREIYRGFLRIGHGGRDYLSHKVHVLRISLAKMESSCYELAVRGTEVPAHLLAEMISQKPQGDDFNDEDEGFY